MNDTKPPEPCAGPVLRIHPSSRRADKAAAPPPRAPAPCRPATPVPEADVADEGDEAPDGASG